MIPEIWTHKPQREEDTWIMDIVRDKLFLNLEQINAVRLHLRVLYVSDLASQGGKCLLMVTKQDQTKETGRKKITMADATITRSRDLKIVASSTEDTP